MTLRSRRLLLWIGCAALLGGLAYWRLSPPPALPECASRGSVDSPKQIATRASGIRLQGWAADIAGVERIDIRAGDRLLASSGAAIARPDVGAAFPQCRFPAKSGFDATLALGNMPPGAAALEVQAVAGNGKVFSIGRVPVDLSQPFGVVDTAGPLEADKPGLISGWALAAAGPVTVHIVAQQKEVLKVAANGNRADVGKAYPAWPQAAASGFEAPVPLRILPRGRYRLKLRLEDSQSHVNEIAGPEVVNDLPIGKVLGQRERIVDAAGVELRAWVSHEDGIRSAEVETEAGERLGAMRLAAAAQPLTALRDPRFKTGSEAGESLSRGSLYRLKLPRAAIPPGLQRLQVKVSSQSGKTAILPGPLVLDRNPGRAQTCGGAKFRVFYPGGAHDFRRKFPELQELRSMSEGGCVEIGIRARVEYLRTTRGKSGDYAFDANFPERLRNRNGKEMTGESLAELLAVATQLRVPLLITLDGGVWADAKFPAPDVDIVDVLEQDERAVQWNQFGKSEPDDALKGLAGANDSPELARMMSLNRYNQKFLSYKKRNLQAAVRAIVEFSRKHPELYVAINLDPDEYINPWFYLTQWYDYNPDTLRQYREWLFHLGPYADGGELAFSRREPALTLAEANRLAKQGWAEIGAIEPPRKSIDYGDPWQQLWTQFKRHLVARHYDDLARWAAEAGLPPERIHTSQTFIQSDVAVRVGDQASGWTDQAGVSIEGAKPRQGHLGAILYGPASRNEGKPRSGSSLIDNIRLADPHWAAVEFHPATIAFPDLMPSHAQAYATIEAIMNGGAEFVSPMWGSQAGDRSVHPKRFKAYDVMEGSAFEYQLVWWLQARQTRPLGSLYFPFGNRFVSSADGWSAAPGTSLKSGNGVLQLSSEGKQAGIVSPRWVGRPMAGDVELTVTGTWPPGTALSAELLFDNGGKLPCRMEFAPPQAARCRFPFAPGRQLAQLTLLWNSQDMSGAVNAVSATGVTLLAIPGSSR